MLTETKIEIMVEKKMNALDSLLIKGKINQETYDNEVELLDIWAEKQYEALKR